MLIGSLDTAESKINNMGLFSSNRVTRKNIIESLSGFFDTGYKSLSQGLIQVFEGKIEINNEQKKELMVVAMLAVTEATSKTWGKLAEEKELVGKKPREIMLKQYFSNAEEFERFEELFNKRSKEYHEVLQPENTELALQFGQIFCTHFLDKDKISDLEIDSKNTAIMMFVGMMFIKQMTGVKKFFDEIMAKCVFDW